MIGFRVVSKIRKEAISSIRSNSDGIRIGGKRNKILFFSLFYLFPTLIAVIAWFSPISLSELSGYVVTAISIFTGLFFSLLLNISSKIRIEKENKDKDVANFKAFKENMKQISHITQYVIFIGILIILLLLINYLLEGLNCVLDCFILSISLYFLVRYFICILAILNRFHFLLRDEINNIL